MKTKRLIKIATALVVSGGLQSHGQAVSNRLFAENFEGLPLGPNREEGLAGVEVWTATPPAGWVQDNSQMPGFGTALDGVVEWAGFTFANKDWWVSAAGNQRRAEWHFGSGTVMVSDPDEWDDAAHAPGLFNAYISAPSVALKGAPANSLILAFDSSWRPEAFDDGAPNFPINSEGRPINNQNGVVGVAYDGGTTNLVIDFSSDSESPNFHPDVEFINESVVVALNNPAGAANLKMRVGMLTAANDWWWSVDNFAIGYPPLLTAVVGNGVAVTNRIAEALGKSVDLTSVAVKVNGTAVAPLEVVRENERVYASYTGTTVFAPRSKVLVSVQYKDNTGKLIEDTGDFVAPGYLSVTSTPRSFTARLTDAEWLTINEAGGIQLELNGTPVTAASVTRTDAVVSLVYNHTGLFPSGSTQSLKATYRSSTGQVLTETVSFKTPSYVSLSEGLATGLGTGADAGMFWRTHQVPTNRPASLAIVENQLAGLLGASVHDTTAEVNGKFPITVVNFEQAAGVAGNFNSGGEGVLAVADEGIPGIPGTGEANQNDFVAGEALTFVEIPAAGLYTMVVNSDDGFQVSVGTATSPKMQVIGEFDGGRGAADTVMYFSATKPGVYLFRLLWMEGGGGASVEWFTVNPDGSRALVNGAQAGALKSFRRRTVAEPSGVSGGVQSIGRSGSNVVINYSGTLKSAAEAAGPYTPVAGATSPFTVAPSDARRFYRAD